MAAPFRRSRVRPPRTGRQERIAKAVSASPPQPETGLFSAVERAAAAIPDSHFGMHPQHVINGLKKYPDVTDQELRYIFGPHLDAIMADGAAPYSERSLQGHMTRESLLEFIGERKYRFRPNDSVPIAGEQADVLRRHIADLKEDKRRAMGDEANWLLAQLFDRPSGGRPKPKRTPEQLEGQIRALTRQLNERSEDSSPLRRPDEYVVWQVTSPEARNLSARQFELNLLVDERDPAARNPTPHRQANGTYVNVRGQVVETPDGRTGWVASQVQSDLVQRGRRFGTLDLDEMREGLAQIDREIIALNEAAMAGRLEPGEYPAKRDLLSDRRIALTRSQSPTELDETSQWTNAALVHLLNRAARGEADFVAIPTAPTARVVQENAKTADFYGEALPNRLRKLAQRFGGVVTEEEIEGASLYVVRLDGDQRQRIREVGAPLFGIGAGAVALGATLATPEEAEAAPLRQRRANAGIKTAIEKPDLQFIAAVDEYIATGAPLTRNEFDENSITFEPFRDERLTPAQNKIVEMLRNGLPREEVEVALDISKNNLKVQVHNIRKAGVEIPEHQRRDGRFALEFEAFIAGYLKDNPEANRKRIAEHLGVNKTWVNQMLERQIAAGVADPSLINRRTRGVAAAAVAAGVAAGLSGEDAEAAPLGRRANLAELRGSVAAPDSYIHTNDADLRYAQDGGLEAYSFLHEGERVVVSIGQPASDFDVATELAWDFSKNIEAQTDHEAIEPPKHVRALLTRIIDVAREDIAQNQRPIYFWTNVHGNMSGIYQAILRRDPVPGYQFVAFDQPDVANGQRVYGMVDEEFAAENEGVDIAFREAVAEYYQAGRDDDGFDPFVDKDKLDKWRLAAASGVGLTAAMTLVGDPAMAQPLSPPEPDDQDEPAPRSEREQRRAFGGSQPRYFIPEQALRRNQSGAVPGFLRAMEASREMTRLTMAQNNARRELAYGIDQMIAKVEQEHGVSLDNPLSVQINIPFAAETRGGDPLVLEFGADVLRPVETVRGLAGLAAGNDRLDEATDDAGAFRVPSALAPLETGLAKLNLHLERVESERLAAFMGELEALGYDAEDEFASLAGDGRRRLTAEDLRQPGRERAVEADREFMDQAAIPSNNIGQSAERLLGTLAGGLLAAPEDPSQLLSMVFPGGGGRTLVGAATRSALMNAAVGAGVEAAIAPEYQRFRQERGLETVSYAEAVATAGVGGAVFGGALGPLSRQRASAADVRAKMAEARAAEANGDTAAYDKAVSEATELAREAGILSPEADRMAAENEINTARQSVKPEGMSQDDYDASLRTADEAADITSLGGRIGEASDFDDGFVRSTPPDDWGQPYGPGAQRQVEQFQQSRAREAQPESSETAPQPKPKRAAEVDGVREGAIHALFEMAKELRRPARQPQRLSDWVRKKGGVRFDPGGEVREQLKDIKRPGLRNDKTGVDANTLAIDATEEGFFQSTPLPSDFLRALRGDAGGAQAVYRHQDANAVAEWKENQRIAADFDEAGVDIRAADDELRQQIGERMVAPRIEEAPAPVNEPPKTGAAAEPMTFDSAEEARRFYREIVGQDAPPNMRKKVMEDRINQELQGAPAMPHHMLEGDGTAQDAFDHADRMAFMMDRFKDCF